MDEVLSQASREGCWGQRGVLGAEMQHHRGLGVGGGRGGYPPEITQDHSEENTQTLTPLGFPHGPQDVR